MVIVGHCTPPEEGVVHKQECTQAHFEGFARNGTLYIAESQVYWIGDTNEGFRLQYKAISLHAVSRDLSSYPQPCLYLMLDPDLTNQADLPDSDGEEDRVLEIRFVPQNSDALDTMFNAMSSCQALHPDDDDSFSDEDFGAVGDAGGATYFNSDQDAEYLTPEAQETLQRLEAGFNNGVEQRETLPEAGGLQDDRGGAGDAHMEDEDVGDQFEDADMER